jgi:hypothetical protein
MELPLARVRARETHNLSRCPIQLPGKKPTQARILGCGPAFQKRSLILRRILLADEIETHDKAAGADQLISGGQGVAGLGRGLIATPPEEQGQEVILQACLIDIESSCEAPDETGRRSVRRPTRAEFWAKVAFVDELIHRQPAPRFSKVKQLFRERFGPTSARTIQRYVTRAADRGKRKNDPLQSKNSTPIPTLSRLSRCRF